MKRTAVILLLALFLLPHAQAGDGPDSARAKKSVKKAFLMSLILPGAGEYYLGHRRAGYSFLAAEAAGWLSVTGFTMLGTWKQEDAVAWAAQYAGIDTRATEGDDTFFKNLGDYMNLEDYNRGMRLTDNGDLQYTPGTGYDWEWTGEEEWDTYISLRRSSRKAYGRATLTGGLIALNHLVSALNTIRLSRAQAAADRIKGTVTFRYLPGSDAVAATWVFPVNP